MFARGAAVFSVFAMPEIARPSEAKTRPPRKISGMTSSQNSGYPGATSTRETRMPTSSRTFVCITSNRSLVVSEPTRKWFGPMGVA